MTILMQIFLLCSWICWFAYYDCLDLLRRKEEAIWEGSLFWTYNLFLMIYALFISNIYFINIQRSSFDKFTLDKHSFVDIIVRRMKGAITMIESMGKLSKVPILSIIPPKFASTILVAIGKLSNIYLLNVVVTLSISK